MINKKIPKDIQLTVKTLKENLHVCCVKHKVTNLSTWFLFETKENYTNMLKKAIITVSVGYTRKLVLHGVGFKADIIKDKHNNTILSLRIGKKLPCDSVLPENVHMFVEGNTVHAWAPNVSMIDNLFHKILRNKAIKKGTITSSK